MAIKHVVTDGIGFTVPSYLLTEGIGDFSAAAGGGVGVAEQEQARRRTFLKWRLKRYVWLFLLPFA